MIDEATQLKELLQNIEENKLWKENITMIYLLRHFPLCGNQDTIITLITGDFIIVLDIEVIKPQSWQQKILAIKNCAHHTH